MLASRRLLVFACFADLFLLFLYWFFSSGARRNGKEISQWKYRYLSSNWRQVRFFRSQEGLYFLKKLNEVRVEDRLVSTCLTSQSVVLYLDFPLPTLLFLHLATLSAALSFTLSRALQSIISPSLFLHVINTSIASRSRFFSRSILFF